MSSRQAARHYHAKSQHVWTNEWLLVIAVSAAKSNFRGEWKKTHWKLVGPGDWSALFGSDNQAVRKADLFGNIFPCLIYGLN